MIFSIAILIFSGCASAELNYWNAFKGEYTIRNRTCESTLPDKACHESAALHIEEIRSITWLTILNHKGKPIRQNDLVEKSDKNTRYRFSGSPEAPSYIVEAFNSSGKIYFLNRFDLRRENQNLVFEHYTESIAGTFRRKFVLE